MKQKQAFIVLSLMLLSIVLVNACSLNRQTPAGWDKAAMETDIRAAIAAAVPGKTFAIEVNVDDDRNVRLEGHVDSQADKDAIVAKVRQVNGVKSVNATGIHVQ